MPPPPESQSLPAPVLDYHSVRRRDLSPDAGVLVVSGVGATLLGLAVLAGLGEALRETWPSFGMTLAAVPIGLIGFAFLSLAVAAFRGVRR